MENAATSNPMVTDGDAVKVESDNVGLIQKSKAKP